MWQLRMLDCDRAAGPHAHSFLLCPGTSQLIPPLRYPPKVLSEECQTRLAKAASTKLLFGGACYPLRLTLPSTFSIIVFHTIVQ